MTFKIIQKCLIFDRLGFSSKWSLLVFFMFSFAVAFCFQLGDLVTTSWQGYKVWDFLVEGRLMDFYPLCQSMPNFDGAGYDPQFYMVFALWNLPIWLIHKIISIPVNPGIVTYWSRVMLGLLYLLSATTLKDIVSIMSSQADDDILLQEKKNHNAECANAMFLLTPFAFFAIVVLGCYDIIAIFFSLLAIRAFLKGKVFAFAILFGISNMFKYMTFIIYIPLLLLLEKRAWQIVYSFVLGVVPTLLGVLLKKIMSSSVAQGELHERVVTKFLAWTISNGHTVPASVLFIGFFVICYAAYSIKCTSTSERNNWMAFIPLVCFSWFFIVMAPNPQWTVFLAPFLVLNLCLNPDHKDTLLLAEAGAFIGFTGMCFVSTHTDEQLIDVCSALSYVFRFQKLYHNFKFDTCALTSSIQCLPSILLSLYMASLVCFNLLSMPIRAMHSNTGAPITRKDMLLRFSVIFVFIVPVSLCYTLSYIYR